MAPAVAALPEREREILRLRFVEDLTQSQIAKQVGVSQMHVSRLLRRSLDKVAAAAAAGTATTPSFAGRLGRCVGSVGWSSTSNWSSSASSWPCRDWRWWRAWCASPTPSCWCWAGWRSASSPACPTCELEPDLVLLLFLPPLLYAAAFFANLRELRSNARPIGMLAIGLVIATMLTWSLSWPTR